MQQKLITEYEWRQKANIRGRKYSSHWGAQCFFPHARKRRVFHDRSFQRFILLCVLISAMMLPVFHQPDLYEEFEDGTVPAGKGMEVRHVSAVTYEIPGEWQFQNRIFTRNELLKGKMLYLDEGYRLPQDRSAPNTASVARLGNGEIPVRSLSVKTGEETISALGELFAQLRREAITGIYVCRGATTQKEIDQLLIRETRALMAVCPPEQAVRSAYEMLMHTGISEYMQEYTVEIRQIDPSAQTPDERTLEATPEGQRLLQLAWRYGFVRSSRNHPYRFRYVGKAHATAMTYLDLELKEYLEWLHQKQSLVVSAGGKPQYLILCKPVTGNYAAIDLPFGAFCEVSLDNLGYMLAACTL